MAIQTFKPTSSSRDALLLQEAPPTCRLLSVITSQRSSIPSSLTGHSRIPPWMAHVRRRPGSGEQQGWYIASVSTRSRILLTQPEQLHRSQGLYRAGIEEPVIEGLQTRLAHPHAAGSVAERARVGRAHWLRCPCIILMFLIRILPLHLGLYNFMNRIAY